MGILRTIFHIATLGIVDGNEEVKRKNSPSKRSKNNSTQTVTIFVGIQKALDNWETGHNNEMPVGQLNSSFLLDIYYR